MEGENQPNAPSGDPVQAPSTTPTTPPVPTPPAPPTAKLEVKDGAMTLDGRKIVYESDLIAAKESLKKQIDEAQTVHTDAIDKAKVELSDNQQQLASANAKLQELEKARETGAVSAEDAAKSKQELEAANSSAEQAKASALELRRQLITLTYQIPAEQLKEKNLEQLDSLEEALKAIVTSRGGGGPYALGGGGAGAVPATDMDRASKILEATPIRGVRNEPPPAK